MTYTFEEIGCDGDAVVVQANFELSSCTVEFDTTQIEDVVGHSYVGHGEFNEITVDCDEVISKTIWVSSLCVIEDDAVIHNWKHGDEITPMFAAAMQVAVEFAGDNIEDINDHLRGA